jgi:phosphoribosylaminoimidazole carboxylase (NCAIR synthetase)
MFAIAARRMGYRVHTFSPDDDTPTGQVADVEVSALYDGKGQSRIESPVDALARVLAARAAFAPVASGTLAR